MATWTSEPQDFLALEHPNETPPIFAKIIIILVATILNIVAPIILIVLTPLLSNLVGE